MNTGQFREYVVRPTLSKLPFRHDQHVENLLIGTAAHESGGFKYIHQINGPALSFYQIEPATHDDVWGNYLSYRPELAGIVGEFGSTEFDLITDMAYATVIARLIYLRVPEKIPTDVVELASYWKVHWNTNLGKGTTQEWLANYYRYVDNKVRMP